MYRRLGLCYMPPHSMPPAINCILKKPDCHMSAAVLAREDTRAGTYLRSEGPHGVCTTLHKSSSAQPKSHEWCYIDPINQLSLLQYRGGAKGDTKGV